MDELDCQYKYEIKCPHCGYDHDNSWEMMRIEDGNTSDIFCGSCNGLFQCECTIDVNYTSTIKEGVF